MDWKQIVAVLEGLAISPKRPVKVSRRVVVACFTDPDLHLSKFFARTKDGQKSIMLTIIGLLPASYALNPQATDQLTQLSQRATQAIPLIQRYGDDVKDQALKTATGLQQAGPEFDEQASRLKSERDKPDSERRTHAQLRGYVYDIVLQTKHVFPWRGSTCSGIRACNKVDQGVRCTRVASIGER